MKTAYFDCPSGAAGDMILAALIDAGLDPDALRDSLSTLSIEKFHIEIEKVSRSGIACTGIRVVQDEPAGSRGFPEIEKLIRASSLPEEVRERAVGIFRILGEAEAKVHRIPLEKVHFHEVGAVDAIVDIVGVVTGLHLLGVTSVYASVPATGSGTVRAAHGVLPLPAPATLEVLCGRSFRPTDVEGELLTPTGAALLVGLTDRFSPPPPMTIESIGYGAGTAVRKELPNLIRLVLGSVDDALPSEPLVLLETDVDDVIPEILGSLFERALTEGALDLVVLPNVMKKNRPGYRVSLLARPADRDRMVRLLLEETGTLGVRCVSVDRFAVRREIVERETRFGIVRFKRAYLPGGKVRITPEHDDCASLAREKGVPLLEVWESLIRDAEKGGE